MGMPTPPGTAQGTNKIGMRDAFLKKGVDVGGPGEFGVESNSKQFNLVLGSDGRVIEVERES